MKKKLSKKEREENVTKGFLTDFLEEGGYVTESFIVSQNYATKDYVSEIFNYYQSDMKHHIDSLIERQHDYFCAIIETLEGRFERNERDIDSLGNRVSKLEIKPSF